MGRFELGQFQRSLQPSATHSNAQLAQMRLIFELFARQAKPWRYKYTATEKEGKGEGKRERAISLTISLVQ